MLCGLSTRAVTLFLEPLLAARDATGFALAEALEVVGVIEPDAERTAAFEARYGLPLRRFAPEEWAAALRETRPDLLLVAVPDYLHEAYILRGLEAGLDIVTEKPMVISTAESARVLAAERASRGRVRVAFNYRYNPLHARLKAFFDEGRLGRVVQVDFQYTLDTLHGASYFYRWNRERRFSGSLAVHKCCHSFDLVRWMLGQEPQVVTALGGLDYYGPKSPHRPASPEAACPYFTRWFANGDEASLADDHPIYHLQGDKGLPFPHQYPERLSLYDAAIDVEDNYSALIAFDGGTRMTFSVNFSAPWEGYRMVANGTHGRLEVECYPSPGRCPFPAQSRATFTPLFGGAPEPLEWESAAGGHGGADPEMLRHLFHSEAEDLPTARDGAMAVAMGEAIWRSALAGGQPLPLRSLPGGEELEMPRPNRQRAFSLLEALFAVALLAVLALLLASVVQNARQQARATGCLAQLRSLWGAAMEYAQDHNGRFSSINVEKSQRDPKSPGFREYLGYTANVFENTLYSCPEAQRSKYAAGGNMYRSYSVGRFMVSNWAPADSGATVVNGAMEVLRRVPYPHEALYLADGVPNTGSTPASGEGINYYTNLNASNVADALPLHGGRLNAVYLDGHASAHRIAELQRPAGNVLWGGTDRNPTATTP